VPYVFGNLSNTGFAAADYGPADRGLSDLMVGYWTNFAKTGDPNGPGLPPWPHYDLAAKAYLHLSSALPGNAVADRDLRGALCALLPDPTHNQE
jgi:para-nitrobenzyl esterase